LRRRDVPWRRIRRVNDRLAWVANAEGLTLVDPNSWMREGDCGREDEDLNGRGKRQLGNLYARVSGLESGETTEDTQ
jgi:hypothetical protein